MPKQFTIRVRKFFSGYEDFVVEAENKVEAINKVCEKIARSSHYDQYSFEGIRCVKKNKPSKRNGDV